MGAKGSEDRNVVQIEGCMFTVDEDGVSICTICIFRVFLFSTFTFKLETNAMHDWIGECVHRGKTNGVGGRGCWWKGISGLFVFFFLKLFLIKFSKYYNYKIILNF